MQIPFVDLHAQYLSIKPSIDAAIATVIAESAFIRSRFVSDFERDFAAAVGVGHCISCANGTDSLYVLMRGLRVSPGDEVITSAHSWISSSETVTQAGGSVVFCDTDSATFTMDPARLERLITPRTVGIIPVHLYGQPADMDPILDIASRHGLWVIEDCAQAHMAEYRGRKVGTMGTAASFSFYPGKNLGAMGDAGAIVTNDRSLADWCAMFARHGGKGSHQIEGINSRLDGLHAAVLSAKLPHLAKWTAERRRVAARYDELLAGLPGIVIPRVAPGRSHVWHLYVIETDHRDRLMSHLNAAGISTMLNYPKALPFYPCYSRLGHSSADFPNAYRAQDRILSLPIYPEMTDEMISYVADSIRNFKG
jgi:dTDP-4-amino-4,6-dideoxygalactose transaminase